MIKGLISLFTSGIIFNPMVLLGIVLGIFAMVRMDAEKIRTLATDYHLYLLVLLISFVYVFVFKKVYKDGGAEVDYPAMLWAGIAGVLKFVLAFLLSMSFVAMITF